MKNGTYIWGSAYNFNFKISLAHSTLFKQSTDSIFYISRLYLQVHFK